METAIIKLFKVIMSLGNKMKWKSVESTTHLIERRVDRIIKLRRNSARRYFLLFVADDRRLTGMTRRYRKQYARKRLNIYLLH